MPFKKPLRKHLRALCAEVHEDDGVDPRDLLKSYREPHKSGHRKAQQLCGQVGEAVAMLLAESPEDALRGLLVASVAPAPDTSRLRVTVLGPEDDPGFDPVEVLDALERRTGWLRSGVASAIHRRKAPSLAFRLALRDD